MSDITDRTPQCTPMRPTVPEIILIAAVARNGVIGRDDGLVFHDPVDQRYFRQVTMGHPVIMGRTTWESLPPRFRPLPGRRNVVLSRDPAFQPQGAHQAATFEQALALAGDANRVFVIGGAQIYAQALPMADSLMLTEIDAELEGDVHFPPWDRAQFEQTSRVAATSAAGLPMHFVTYQRRP